MNKKSFTPRVLIAFDDDPFDAVDVPQDVLDDSRHGLVKIKRDFIFSHLFEPSCRCKAVNLQGSYSQHFIFLVTYV